MRGRPKRPPQRRDAEDDARVAEAPGGGHAKDNGQQIASCRVYHRLRVRLQVLAQRTISSLSRPKHDFHRGGVNAPKRR